MIDDAETYSFSTRSVCPACESQWWRMLADQPFASGAVGDMIRNFYGRAPTVLGEARFRVARCDDCGMYFQIDVAGDELLNAIYSSWVRQIDDPEEAYDDYRRDINAPWRSRDGHELMTAAAFLRVELRDMTTLDFGMGWGLWARIAGAIGCRSYGVELDRTRRDFASRCGVGVIEPGDLDAHQFDFINTEQVMEHVLFPSALVKDLARVLKPGGILKVSVPHGERAARSIADLEVSVASGRAWTDFMPIHPLEHINAFSRRSTKTMAARAGLVEVRPAFAHRYAFLLRKGSIGPDRPRQTLKALARPFYQYSNCRNLYQWFRRPR